jgi:uncharacterized protein (TIGR02147 family)
MINPNVFEYTDYRKFLKDYYEENKQKKPYFSYRYMSKKAGINASAFFKYVIEGKRGLTKSSIMKTVQAIGFSQDEAEYFENLVYFNQAATLKDKDSFFKLLMNKRKKIDIKYVGKHQYEFYMEWYHTVIRELAVMADFDDDFHALSRLLVPSIKPKQAKESVELLERLGFLKKGPDNTYAQTNPLISTGPEIKNYAVIQFQMAMMKLALEAFERHKGEDRLMAATTFSISEQTYNIFKAKIRQMRQDLMELARIDENPERVYHLNINLFPASKKIEKRTQ